MNDSLISSLLLTLLATAAVLLLAWGALALLKRSRLLEGRRSGASAASELHFIRAMPVGSKERLVVVRYRDAELLLGVTSQSINLLRHDEIAQPDSTSPATRRESPSQKI